MWEMELFGSIDDTAVLPVHKEVIVHCCRRVIEGGGN